VNFAVTEAMNSMGANAAKWTWTQPGVADISPHAEFVWNLYRSLGNTPEARDARRKVLEYPLDFFPGETEFHNILDAYESAEGMFDNEGNPTHNGLLRVLGFPVLKPQKPRSLEDEMLYQAGFSRTARGEIMPTLTERERQPVESTY
jgi:hypothetical protein